MNNNVKSATVAGLLGIFLGSVGAHDWYLGDKKKGTIHVCLAASGLIVSVIATAILPAALSYRTLLSMAGLIALLSGVAGLIMAANGIWGLVEGIMILTQGDAGLARKGYNVAQPNMNYGGNNGYNNYGNQPMNNFGAQQNMNGMNNMNNMGNMGNMGNANNMNNGQMNGIGNNQMNQNQGNGMNGGNGGSQNGQ